MMGQLGRAWVSAWVMHGSVHGWCMCILPGLVMLDLGVGSCLVDDGEEVFGVVS